MNFFERLGHRLAGVGNDEVASGAHTGYVTYELRPYQYNELSHAHRQGFLSNFVTVKEPLYFTVSGNKSSIQLYISVAQAYETYLLDMFYSSFPSSELKKTSRSFPTSSLASHLQLSSDAELYGTDHFSKGGTYVDPFKEVLSFFFSVPSQEILTIQYEFSFDISVSIWKKIAARLSDQLMPKKSTSEGKSDDKNVDQKKPLAGKMMDIGIGFSYMTVMDATSGSVGTSGERGKNVKNVKNIKSGRKGIETTVEKMYAKYLKQGSVKILSKKCKNRVDMPHAVHLFHVPTKANQNKSLQYVPYRKLSAPVDVPTLENTSEQDITFLGTTDYKDTGEQFGIKKEDKFRHIYIVGKTGMGKSTFISNMVRSDMVRDNGIAVVDPHGDLIDDVMAHIPSHRTNDVFLFDVSDTEHPVGFNILEASSPDQKNLIASAVVSIFKKLFANSRGPRLEYILRNVMLSILEYPNATLMHVMRMLTDKNFREEVLTYVQDPVVMKFWRDEYDTRQDRQKNEAIGPIANKIGQFLSSPIVRNIFSQPKSTLNIREIMDSGKILLINLSKGKIGEDNASMIGSFLVSKFQIDAMSRADMSARDRKDFYLYIDEFQNFATDSFESILSEARKYRLSLIVANQYTSQIQENVRNAIFGNVGTLISFGLGYDDATMMSMQYKELIDANDLLSLPKFTAYIKLMVDGITSEPFSMKTSPLPDPIASDEIRAKIRQQSRQRYAMSREKLEGLLKARSEKKFTKAEKIMEQAAAEAKTQSVSTGKGVFTLADVKLGKTYTGLVKLKYNYGLFVTVKGVEGLLHKSNISVPSGVENWKGLYEVGDRIEVVAKEWREMKGEKKIVWGQG